MKKTWLLLVVSLAVALAGCGGAKKGGEVGGSSVSDGLASDKLLELSIHMHYWDSTPFDDEWVPFKKAVELTNIKLKGTVSKSVSDSEQAFNIMIASDDVPDIIHSTTKNMDKYGQEGALIPLNDLIDEYAPNIKKALDEFPGFKEMAMASDGNVYHIPSAREGLASVGIFIRQDWLDKLDLQMPTTTEEYYNVLSAFRNNDPNGNGAKDEVPLFFRSKVIDTLLPYFEAEAGWYYRDGQVKYGRIEPNFKTAMKEARKWYEEGLIDKEVYTRGGKSRDILFTDNLGGSTIDWFVSTTAYNHILADKVPGFKVVAVPPITDINGNRPHLLGRESVQELGWGISVNNKHPIETIKYMDFWLSEEGRELINFGIEGEHFDKIDGFPALKPEILNAPETALTYLNNIGLGARIGTIFSMNREKQMIDEIGIAGWDMYEPVVERPFMTPKFSNEEYKVINAKLMAIQTYAIEKEQRWLMGIENIDSTFDSYVEQLKKMGVEELISAYDQAYKRSLSR